MLCSTDRVDICWSARQFQVRLEETHFGLGLLLVYIPIQQSYFLQLSVAVVDVGVPLLICLHFLPQFGMVIYTSRNELMSVHEQQTLPLVNKYGQLYIEWSECEMMYTEPEPRNVHKNLFHQESGRLYAVLRSADPSNTDSSTLQDLETVS